MTNGILLLGIPLVAIFLLLVLGKHPYVTRSVSVAAAVGYAVVSISAIRHEEIAGVTVQQLWQLIPNVTLTWQDDIGAALGVGLCAVALLVTALLTQVSRERALFHMVAVLGCTIAAGSGTLVGLAIGIGLVNLSVWIIVGDRANRWGFALLLSLPVIAMLVCSMVMLEDYGTSELINLTSAAGGGIARTCWLGAVVIELITPLWCSPKFHDLGIFRWTPVGAAILLIHALQIQSASASPPELAIVFGFFGVVSALCSGLLVFHWRVHRTRSVHLLYVMIVLPMLVSSVVQLTTALILIVAVVLGAVSYSMMTDPLRTVERQSRGHALLLGTALCAITGFPGSILSVAWYVVIVNLINQGGDWGIVAILSTAAWITSALTGVTFARLMLESAAGWKVAPSGWERVFTLTSIGAVGFALFLFGILPGTLLGTLTALVPGPGQIDIQSWSVMQLAGVELAPIQLLCAVVLIAVALWGIITIFDVEIYPDGELPVRAAKPRWYLALIPRWNALAARVRSAYGDVEQGIGSIDVWLRDQPRMALILIVAGVFAVLVH